MSFIPVNEVSTRFTHGQPSGGFGASFVLWLHEVWRRINFDTTQLSGLNAHLLRDIDQVVEPRGYGQRTVNQERQSGELDLQLMRLP